MIEQYGSEEAVMEEMSRRAKLGSGANRKLSDKDVKKIRESDEIDRVLAAKYSVTKFHINRIRNHRVR